MLDGLVTKNFGFSFYVKTFFNFLVPDNIKFFQDYVCK